MNVTIEPGFVRITTPYGDFRFDGLSLAQLENTARASLDGTDITGLLSCIEALVPGFWAFYDRRPEKQQSALARAMKDAFSGICRSLIAGNLYPIMLLTDIAYDVRCWTIQEEQEKARE